MRQIHLHGKGFSNDDFKRLVIGGQTNADTIRFVIPKIYADELDFSGDEWTWSITYENQDGQGDTVLLTKSASALSENLYLDWKPSQTATQVEGKLICQVTGTRKTVSDTVVSRFTCAPFTVYVEEWLSPEPITQALPGVIEQALEIMAEYAADLQEGIQASKDAKKSADEADASAKAAAQSQSAAKASEDKAKASETAAKESEEKALASEKAAAQSESAAKASEDKAKASETAAKSSEEKALASEKAAAQSESAAKSSEDNAKASETAAKGSEEKAAQSESAAEDYSHISERFAKGTEGGQPVSSGDGYQDNSKYYKELAEETVTVATQRMDQLDEKIEELLSTNRAYSTTIGDGVTKVFVIRHNLQSDKYLAQVWSNVDGQPSRWKLEKTDLNTATITFEAAPPQGGVTVVFVGVAQGEAPSDEILAAAAQSTAAAKAAERYAKGTEGGQPVSSGDGYQDNSKYYKDLAEETVTLATQRMDQLDEKIEELLSTNRAFSATIGDGSTKVFTIRHDLQSEDFLAQVWSNVDGQPSRWKLEKTDLNTATITFESAPPQDGVTVVFVGVAQAALSFVAGVKWQNVEDVMVTAEQLSADLALSDSEIMAAFEARKN